MPHLYGLIGYPLTHSFSPAYFAAKFKGLGITGCRYLSFPLQTISELPGLLAANPDIRGLNVTIPYKRAVLPFLHYIHPVAQRIGAVNTIKVLPNGQLHGFNTDYDGFKTSLSAVLTGVPARALILGTGGSAATVRQVLADMGIPYKSVSRVPGSDYQYKDVTEAVIASAPLIVNTTPVGMYPNVEQAPAIPYQALSPAHTVYDLIYNPAETVLLRLAGQRGAVTKNGLQMLHLQADRAWEIWNS